MHMGNVNEWLRTKATYFLAGICVILMCVWIVPWGQLIRQRPATTGQLFGKNINGEEVMQIARTLRIFQQQRHSNMEDDLIVARAWSAVA